MYKLRDILRRLGREERATALTEFLITLPVFVMIFSFMFGLYNKTHELNRIRYRAATEMWTAAMQVHRDGTSVGVAHGRPSMAALNASGIVSGTPSYAGDISQQVIIAALGFGGTGPEMVAGAAHALVFKGDPNDATSNKFADTMSEDGSLPPSFPNNNPVMVFMPAAARSIIPTRHGGIIGTRYGAVEGEATGTVDAAIWGGVETFSATYDVLVSPISYPGGLMDEYFVVGTSRLLADQDPCLETVLEISTSMSDC